MIKRIILLLFTATISSCLIGNPVKPIKDLAKRVLPKHHHFFEFEIQHGDIDFFEIERLNSNKIKVRGNNQIALARGLNHYLREYCHQSVSWVNTSVKELSTPLPALKEKVYIEASVPLRYYLNYCTYSYSMAFWDWKRWEHEIDWMALQGINMPLMAINSQYAVWQNTLKRMNFTDQEIAAFLPGAGYEAWWLMGNLEGFGGLVSNEFITQQTTLQQKILKRLRELDMQPVFQGFYGMVPSMMKDKYPNARIKDQGEWFTYKRPAFLDPTDPLFETISDIYYEEQQKLFGDAIYYGGDPFHEGGTSEGIDVPLAAKKIIQSMRKINPNAVWVLQGWQHNPTPELMSGLNPSETIILDLMACERPQWGGIETSMFNKPGGHQQHQWIWCALPNFGGKTGLHGKMSSYTTGPNWARKHPMGKNIAGIGTAPEGMGTIPVVYDMVYDMAWRKDSINIPQWLNNYTCYRYGKFDHKINKAWNILSSTIYECHNELGGPVESYICARPADTITCASTWGNAEIFYNPIDVVEAWKLFYESKDTFDKIDAYEYDLVDITRQVLADYAKTIHQKMIEAFYEKNKSEFTKYSGIFLDIILDQDLLLSTRKEFMLGTWLNEAKKAGCSPLEKELFVQNAKRQITTWTDINSDLHDYANKEWSGLLKDFYYPRWEAYINYKKDLLNNKNVSAPSFPQMESNWVAQKQSYPTDTNKLGTIPIVNQIYNKYYDVMKFIYTNN